MNISWIESVLNPTCNQNTNRTLSLSSSNLSQDSLLTALGRKFKLPTMGSLPHILGLVCASSPASTILSVLFTASLQPCGTTCFYIPLLLGTPLANSFILCELAQLSWPHIAKLPSLWSCGSAFLWVPQHPVFTALTSYYYCLFACLSLPLTWKHALKRLGWVFNIGSTMCDLGQNCFSSLCLSFLICKMGRKQGNSCDSQYLAYSQVQCELLPLHRQGWSFSVGVQWSGSCT